MLKQYKKWAEDENTVIFNIIWATFLKKKIFGHKIKLFNKKMWELISRLDQLI